MKASVSARRPATIVLLLALAALLPARAPAQTSGPAEGNAPPAAVAAPAGPADTWRVEVLVNGGVAIPAGDLAASYVETERGFGAGIGYALGVRTHVRTAGRLVVSPSFSLLKFGLLETYTDAVVQNGTVVPGEKYQVLTSSLRFGVDLLYQADGPHDSPRPFVGAGAALARHRFTQEFVEDETRYQAKVSALALQFIAGVRLQDFELALTLSASRFSTPRFFFTGDQTRYGWNSAQVTLGYALPRF